MARLDGFSIFGGIVFVVVIFFVIYPVSFPLPLSLSRLLRNVGIRLRLLDPPDTHTSSVELDALPKQLYLSGSIDGKDNKPIRVRIGLSSVPLLGVLLLLITTTIGGNEVAKGIVGEHGVRPYDVLVLFISLAYIATALDATGGLRYLAFQVALRAKSGNQLYLFLYSFFFLSGAVIGNDPIILSGTPFLAYLTRLSGITPPTAWIYAQFLAANVSSAILVSSNPTNVLVAGAFELNFLSGFTKYTILPAVVAAIVVYPVLFYTFKSKRITLALDKTASSPEGRSKQELIPSNFDKPDVDPRSTLVDAQGAIFHTVLLLVTLAVLVGTSFLGVEVWMITAPAAVVGLIRDVFYDLHSSRQAKRVKSSPPPEAHANGQPLHKTPRRVTVPSLWRSFSRRLPSTSLTLSRLPWPLLPFAVGMFILVRSLDRLGYIGIFAEWTARACTSPAAAVFFVGAIVALGLCPLCGTNIGATILAVEVLNNDSFLNAPHVQAHPRILRGAIYAVALASNTGALVTLPSSLAGLLWSRILQQKGIRITQTSFSLINFIPVCIVTFVALAIILVEVLYWD